MLPIDRESRFLFIRRPVDAALDERAHVLGASLVRREPEVRRLEFRAPVNDGVAHWPMTHSSLDER